MTTEQLIERDGAVCIWCGAAPWRRDLTAEHLLPRARRGHGIAENLGVACRKCNKRRGTRSIAAYVRAQLDCGQDVRFDLLDRAVLRLSRSASRRHADYGLRQLELLRRLQPDPAAVAA